MSKKNILAGWAKTSLFPFNPDRVLRSLVKPVASLSIRSEGTEPCQSLEVPHEVLQTPVTPVSSEALSSLLTLIKQDPHDEPSRRRHQKLVQKLANAAHTFFAQQALDRDHIEFLSNMNNEAKVRRKTKSEILGKARVMTFEDIVARRAKRAEQKVAVEAKGKQKHGPKPKRSATAADEPSEPVEPVAVVDAAENSHVAAVEAIVDKDKSHSKRKRARRESEEAIAGSAKRSKICETTILEPARASEVQTVGGGAMEESTAAAAYRVPVARMY